MADQRLKLRHGAWEAPGAAQEAAEQARREADRLQDLRNALARAVRLTSCQQPPAARLKILASNPVGRRIPKL